jgi:hypothetical protein
MNDAFSEEAAPRLFEFVERGETEMPADYLPEARGVMLAGEDMLSAAGYVGGSNRPHKWVQIQPGNYRKYVGKHILMVRQCGGPRSEHWTIERLDEDYNTEALLVPFGHAPIFARKYQAAMRLAEYCHPIPRPPVAGCWKVARVRR